ELDADKIAASVVNLLTNAIKFTPDGGRVTLSAHPTSHDEVEIAIADSGIGLEPRAVNRLFQPFFTQFDSSLHSSGDFGFNNRGLALGLGIAREFVGLRGGGASAEGVLGGGTPVTIPLPRHAVRPLDHDPEPCTNEVLTIPQPGGRE